MAYFKCQISLICLVLLGFTLDKYTLALPKFPYGPASGSATPAPNAPTPLCPSGLSFKSDCNNCFCNPTSGVTGCTLMACPPLEPMTYYQNVTPKPVAVAAPAPSAQSAPAPPAPPAGAVSYTRPSRADIQVSAPGLSLTKAVPIPEGVVKPTTSISADEDQNEDEEQDMEDAVE